MLEVIIFVFSICVYFCFPAAIAFGAMQLFKRNKQRTLAAVIAFVISFSIEYGFVLHLNRSAEVSFSSDNLSQETMDSIADAIVTKHTVTITNENKFWVPIGYQVDGRDNTSGGYWYRMTVFPITIEEPRGFIQDALIK